MIDEKIMIGNWFYSAEHGLPFQWSADDFKEIYNSKAKPIELTEDILIKCGFEKNSYNIYSKQFTDEIDWSMTFEDDEIVLQYCNYNYTLLQGKNIKYLHQLQNLFYCLTGKELEITL